jgi:hypothetical protein
MVPAIANMVASELASYDYSLMASTAYSLSIDLDTGQLFNGAQLIIDALTGPYLLIAGLSLGVAILGAVMAAVTRLRL